MKAATAAERMDRAGTSTPPGQSELTNTPSEQALFGDKGWLDLTHIVVADVRQRGIVGEMVDDIAHDVIDDLLRTWTKSKQISADTTKNWKMAVQRALQRVPRYIERHITWRLEAGVDEVTVDALHYQMERHGGTLPYGRSAARVGVESADDGATAEAYVGAPMDLFDPEGNTVTREEYYQQTATPPRRRKRVS